MTCTRRSRRQRPGTRGHSAWRAGPYASAGRDWPLLASAYGREATEMPVRVSLLRPATPRRGAACGTGRQDLPAVREAHGHPIREVAVGHPRGVTSVGAHTTL